MPCTGVRRFRLWCHIYSLYPARAVSRRRLGWVRLLPAPQGVGPPPPARSRALNRGAPRCASCVDGRGATRALSSLYWPSLPRTHTAAGSARAERGGGSSTTLTQHPPRVHIAVLARYRTSVSIERALRNEHAPGIICFYYAPHDRPAAAAYWTDALPLDAKSGVVGRHTPSR